MMMKKIIHRRKVSEKWTEADAAEDDYITNQHLETSRSSLLYSMLTCKEDTEANEGKPGLLLVHG
jgi:hypothetical protein